MIHKIKGMYDEGNGLSIREIARTLGIARNTVKKYLGMDEAELHEYLENRSRSKRLDDHREYIIHLLETFPMLSAVKVLRKLKEKHPDLAVSDRSARRYIQELKETVTLKQKRYYEPVLDMVPGVQCQVDGGEVRSIQIGGVETRLYFVVFVLSYSRLMYVGLSPDPVDTDAFIHMHDEAFRYFDGRPEECVYDQAKLVVLHEQYRELDLNQKFYAYATTAGFRIHACEGYDPESKGKVEAGVKYVKNNALYGEVFADWKELEQHLKKWLDTIANVRTHATTGEAPWARYERDEHAHMAGYLTPAYLSQGLSARHTRKVDKTGLLSWKSNKYSAPLIWQQARVGVREERSSLVLCDLETGREIARHGLYQGTGKTIKNTDHYRDKQQRIRELEEDIQKEVGKTDAKRLCALLKKTNGRIYKDQLVGLKGLLKHYTLPPVLLDQLCDRSRLATTQIRDYLMAYEAHPDHFDAGKDRSSPGKDTPIISKLSCYAAIVQQRKEEGHDHLH